MTENEEAVHATGTTYADAGLEPPAAARPIYRSQDGPPQLLAVVECPECERLRRTLDDHLLSEAAETRRADRAQERLTMCIEVIHGAALGDRGEVAEWYRTDALTAVNALTRELATFREQTRVRAALAKAEADSGRARADRYLAAIVEYEEATAAEEQAWEAYTSFGSRMMDRSLPPVTDENVKAAFVTVATARNRAYAATGALHAIAEEIVEEARRG